MKRREFIASLGSTAATWPLAAHAQQAAMPVIGLLSGQLPNRSAREVAAFHRGLSEMGFVEGRNVAIESRWADNHYDRLPILAADLAQRRVGIDCRIGYQIRRSGGKGCNHDNSHCVRGWHRPC